MADQNNDYLGLVEDTMTIADSVFMSNYDKKIMLYITKLVII